MPPKSFITKQHMPTYSNSATLKPADSEGEGGAGPETANPLESPPQPLAPLNNAIPRIAANVPKSVITQQRGGVSGAAAVWNGVQRDQ